MEDTTANTSTNWTEDQLRHLAKDVEWAIVLGARLHIEGFLERDIDKTNTGSAIISSLVRLELLPEAPVYSKVIREVWRSYEVPRDIGDRLGKALNAMINEYNDTIIDECGRIINNVTTNGGEDDA